MLKKIVMMAGVLTSLLATTAWAGNVGFCLEISHPNNINGMAIKNTCNYTIEGAWCIVKAGTHGNICAKLDNSWTIHPGQEMPIDARKEDEVYFDGCKGENSIKGEGGVRSVKCR